jgi:hypothetical protein
LPSSELVVSSVADPWRGLVVPALGYGARSDHRPIEPGDHVLTLRPAGSTAPPLVSAMLDVQTGAAYTVAAVGQDATCGLAVIPDDRMPPRPGSGRLRVLDAGAPDPMLDVRGPGGEPYALGLPAGPGHHGARRPGAALARRGGATADVTATGNHAQPPSAPAALARTPSAVPVRATAFSVPALGLCGDLGVLTIGATGELDAPDGPMTAGWYAAGIGSGDVGPEIVGGHVDSRRGPGVFLRLRSSPSPASGSWRRTGSRPPPSTPRPPALSCGSSPTEADSTVRRAMTRTASRWRPCSSERARGWADRAQQGTASGRAAAGRYAQ